MKTNNNEESVNSAPFAWVTVYSAANVVEANIVKGLLISNNVECQLLGETLQGAVGEIPLDQTEVKVQVFTIKQRQAAEILVNYRQVQQSAPDWVCPNCNEHN
ncbi:MAG: putative signal transducing protein, partial [Pseudoalteromonas sp.]